MRARFRSPCVADFKLGTRQHDVTTSEEFRLSLIEKAEISTSKTLGLRLVSLTLTKNLTILKDTTKSDNLELSEGELESEIEMFVPSSLLETVGKSLDGMRRTYLEMLKTAPGLRWYSGSVLITYDGDDFSQEPRVGLIDFAHFHWDITADGGDAQNPDFDDGNIIGLDTFLRMIANCIARASGCEHE
jgi:hypothetical protein